MKVELNRISEPFHFQGKGESDHVINIDSSPAIGGQDKGVRPMELLLMAIGGCASIDFGLILKKQRQKLEKYRIEISGIRKENEAKSFDSIQLLFLIKGSFDEDKINRAIELTTTKYCSVLLSLDPSITITTQFEIE